MHDGSRAFIPWTNKKINYSKWNWTFWQKLVVSSPRTAYPAFATNLFPVHRDNMFCPDLSFTLFWRFNWDKTIINILVKSSHSLLGEDKYDIRRSLFSLYPTINHHFHWHLKHSMTPHLFSPPIHTNTIEKQRNVRDSHKYFIMSHIY